MKQHIKFHPIAGAVALMASLMSVSAMAQTAPTGAAAGAGKQLPAGAVVPGAVISPTSDAAKNQAALDTALAKARAEGYAEGQLRAQAHLSASGLPIGPGQAGVQAPQPGAAASVPGQPGTPIGTVPALPDLPGAAAAAGTNAAGVNPTRLAVDDLMPATIASDVYELKRRMDEITRAQMASASKVAKAVTRSITLTQAAGEETPSIRIASGVPSNVIFIDNTGKPWPIEYAVPGDPNKFDVIMPTTGSSGLQLRPKNPYGYAGLSVKLQGNEVPVSFTVVAGQNEVDTRVDVHVAQRGPNASAPIIDRTGQPNLSDASLSSFLDGVPPNGARELKTSRTGVRAWSWSGRLVVRSDIPLIAPAWIDDTNSPNGVTKAYILPMVPKLTVSDQGRLLLVDVLQ